MGCAESDAGAASLLSCALLCFSYSSTVLQETMSVERDSIFIPGTQKKLCASAGSVFAGFLDSAIHSYTEALSALQPGACSSLYTFLLLRRAAAYSQQQDYDAALQNLDKALLWESESTDCIQLRAEV